MADGGWRMADGGWRIRAGPWCGSRRWGGDGGLGEEPGEGYVAGFVAEFFGEGPVCLDLWAQLLEGLLCAAFDAADALVLHADDAAEQAALGTTG
jgi:hypothetical protein